MHKHLKTEALLTLLNKIYRMRVMAIIERFTLQSSPLESSEKTTSDDFFPGLRISIRATTSSQKDYPEWRLEELVKSGYETIVSDGACS